MLQLNQELTSVNLMSVALLLCCTVAMSFGLTWVFRRYALTRQLIDVPNARSSHQRPTPRGGGVAIVLTFLLGLPILYAADAIDRSTLVALGGSGAFVALIGFLDDHGHIPAHWRLLAHFCAAAWALGWMGGLPPVAILGTVIDMPVLLQLLATFYLVWLLNLYNFMDGIDGLASVEAISVCLGGALLFGLAKPEALSLLAPLMLMAAVLGFLFWNFPPAKIFMGDAGSGFLGLVLGLLSLQAANSDPAFLWAWIILLGVFIVDATVTLMRRILRRQKVHEAHRSHAYQYASRKFGEHRIVTLAVLAINLLWLLPVALAVGFGYIDGALGVAIAYGPLIWLAIYFKAGAAELQNL